LRFQATQITIEYIKRDSFSHLVDRNPDKKNCTWIIGRDPVGEPVRAGDADSPPRSYHNASLMLVAEFACNQHNAISWDQQDLFRSLSLRQHIKAYLHDWLLQCYCESNVAWISS